MVEKQAPGNAKRKVVDRQHDGLLAEVGAKRKPNPACLPTRRQGRPAEAGRPFIPRQGKSTAGHLDHHAQFAQGAVVAPLAAQHIPATDPIPGELPAGHFGNHIRQLPRAVRSGSAGGAWGSGCTRSAGSAGCASPDANSNADLDTGSTADPHTGSGANATRATDIRPDACIDAAASADRSAKTSRNAATATDIGARPRIDTAAATYGSACTCRHAAAATDIRAHADADATAASDRGADTEPGGTGGAAREADNEQSARKCCCDFSNCTNHRGILLLPEFLPRWIGGRNSQRLDAAELN
jgi:hypothetical protein